MRMPTLARRPKPWRAPVIDTPLQVTLDDLTELGVDRRKRTWYSHPRLGELVPRGSVGPDDDLPVAILMPLGEGWQVLEAVPPGTFSLQTSAKVPVAKVKASKPIDALDAIALLAGRSEVLFSGTSAVPAPSLNNGDGYHRTGRAPSRGPTAILHRLERGGVSIRLSANRSSLVVLAPGGRASGVAEAVAVAGPLLLAHLQGAPLRCQVTEHGAFAQTVAVGGTPWCMVCSPESV